MRRNPHNTFRGSGKKGQKRLRTSHGKGSYMESDKRTSERLIMGGTR
jgi:hypothetical protein